MDWDDAYANGAYIEGADQYVAKWEAAAKAFRDELSADNRATLDVAYTDHERNKLDIFEPKAEAKGTAIFVHGGYWLAFDKSYWSHLAQGAIDLGYRVILPSYILSPEAKLSEITQQIKQALQFSMQKFEGDFYLSGHSAGGHLVSRMACENIGLSDEEHNRIKTITSISGLHDLRPLTRTKMNENFKMDMADASAESAALLKPYEHKKIICAVGLEERPEFIRQNDLLVNIWSGFEMEMHNLHIKNRHHFNVIEDLADKDSAITQAFIGNIG